MFSSNNCDADFTWFGAVPSTSLHFVFTVPKGIIFTKYYVLFLSVSSTTLFTVENTSDY